MNRILRSLPALALAAAPAVARSAISGDWKMHFPFDETVSRVADTPGRTYFMGLSQYSRHGTRDYDYRWSTIHYRDKATGAIHTLDRYGRPLGAKAAYMAYNAAKGYLLVIYDDADIDLVYDDGRTVNVPDLAAPSGPGKFETGEVTFDHEGDRAFICTNRGFAILDDAAGRISEIRDYGKAVVSAARLGDRVVLSVDGQALQAPLDSPRRSLADYTPVAGVEYVKYLLPLTPDLCAYTRQPPEGYKLSLMEFADGEPRFRDNLCGLGTGVHSENRDGYTVATGTQAYLLDREGKFTRVNRLEQDRQHPLSSWDGKEFWFGERRRGYFSRIYDGKEWSDGHTDMRPDAPAVFQASDMAWSPRHGLLVDNHGNDGYFTMWAAPVPSLLSAYRGGSWSMLAPAYTNPEQENVITNPNGLSIDPLDPDKVYMGSHRYGMVRLNLSDPADVMHFSNAADPSAALPGFVNVRQPCATWDICRFSEPQFDGDGNLWSSYFDMDAPEKESMKLTVWSPGNRLATVSPETYRPMTTLTVTGVTGTNECKVFALTHPANRGLVLVAPHDLTVPMVVYDFAGTPDDPTDDRQVVVKEFHDNFGDMVPEAMVVENVFEDPATGLVWVPTGFGVFTFNPRTMFLTPGIARRVSTRDADTGRESFLLDGVTVFDITSDSAGRKWFSTLGHGLVCTSPDGHETLGSFTMSNSAIPADDVFTAVENPETGSMMVATSGGLAEFTPSTAARAPRMAAAVWPSTVTPDFHGLVNVSGLPRCTSLNVVDSDGSRVRYIGETTAGAAQWDLLDGDGNPAPAGTYHFINLNSTADGTDSAPLATVRVLR